MTLRVTAYAKINLFLEITGKKANGYHTLETVFQSISLGDTLTMKPSPIISLRCSDPSLPTDERNLVMRAAVLLQKTLKEKRGAAIVLRKRVPMGAGLGGGSSDAAAALKMLCTLWKRRVPESVLHACARRLGADVPFFLTGGTCLARGIGDRLTALAPVSKTWLILVYPNFGVATKEAYGQVRLPFTNRQPVRAMLRLLHSRDDWKDHLFNRFEDLVFPLHPALANVKRDLHAAGASHTLMSGSGSTLFGIVPSEAAGRKTLAKMHRRFPQSWLVHTLQA